MKKIYFILENLRKEKSISLKGGLYHKTQISVAYNSNRIEGSSLSEEQTRFIFETKTIGFKDGNAISVNDIIETVNHFKAFDFLLDIADETLCEAHIKELHRILKNDTFDSTKVYPIGEYKIYRNEVSGKETVLPQHVPKKMKILLQEYNMLKRISLENLATFHKNFEDIHPFRDGNGRVGRLIMFKECLKNSIMPFIILDKSHKQYYYRGLADYNKESGFLIGTLQSAQDVYENWVNYFYANAKKINEISVSKQILTKKQFTRYLIDILVVAFNKNDSLTRAQIDKLLIPEIQEQNSKEQYDRIINDLLTKMRRDRIITNMASRKKPMWKLLDKNIK
jgi:Fic family protein